MRGEQRKILESERPTEERDALNGPHALVPLLTLEEVAQHLRLSPRTIRRLVATGKLPCARLAGRLRFIPADVWDFVSSRLGRD
jgi:excisionase family DNA binding protein